MPIYQFYIDDDRYSVRTLVNLEASSPAEARRLALAHLESSPHHHGVEVFGEGDERLFVLGGVAAA